METITLRWNHTSFKQVIMCLLVSQEKKLSGLPSCGERRNWPPKGGRNGLSSGTAWFWCLCAVCLFVQVSLDQRFLIEATSESSQNHQGTVQESIHVSKIHLPMVAETSKSLSFKTFCWLQILPISTCSMIGSPCMSDGRPILTVGFPCILVYELLYLLFTRI